MAESAEPDVAVIDWSMPKADRIDLIRDCEARCPGRRVVVHTAMEDPIIRSSAFAPGGRICRQSEPVEHLIRAVRLAGAGRGYLARRGRPSCYRV